MFALVNGVVKHSCTHLPFPVVLFFKNGIALCALLPIFIKKNFFSSIRAHFPFLFLRALGGIFISFLMFTSLNYVPLTDVLLLSSTGPLFLPFVLRFWLKQRTHAATWASIAVGFLGVLFIFQPTSGIFHFASILALLAGVFTAVIMVLIQKLPKDIVPAIIFCYLFGATSMAFPGAIGNLPTLSATELPALCSLGVLFGIGQWLYTSSLRLADAPTLAPFLYAFVVTGIVLDWIIWAKIPTPAATVGISLVILGGCATLLSLRRKQCTERDSNP